MKIQNRTFLMLLAAVTLAGKLTAQTPFWSEKFTSGIPAGWTNVDASGQSIVWTWCSNPALGDTDPGCPQPWDDALNQQVAFQATTASTGFVTLDSDDAGELNKDHISQLTTTAINCTGKSQVFLSFQTHIGVFQHVADDLAIVRVSTDKTTWTTYKVFNGIIGTNVGNRWSANPEVPIVDITPTAANKATVYLQFQWTGNYDYHWNIDDIGLYPENPLPRHDLAFSDIFYPASSYATPVSQIATDTFGFYGFVSNPGLAAQTNVKLKAWITDNNDLLIYADSITLPELAAGVVDSQITIPSSFAPELPVGAYKLRYSVTSDSLDQRPADNYTENEFLVTNSVFSKEDGPEQFFRPTNLTDPWYVGNYYRMSKASQENYQAIETAFTFTTDEAMDNLPITDVEATIYLLRVNNNINDNLGNLDDAAFLNSFQWVGIASYSAPDTLVDDGSIKTIALEDLNSPVTKIGVPLEKGARYFLAIGYEGASSNTYHGFNDDNNYLFTSSLIYTSDWGTFGGDVNCVLRMAISLVTSTDDKPLPDSAMNVFPSPTSDVVNVEVKFDNPMDATITIADLTGRVIMFEDRPGLTNEVLSYNLPKNLAAGTYLARIATPEGTKTKRFVVVK